MPASGVGGGVFKSLTLCEAAIRVRVFQDPPQTLFAHNLRRVIRQQEGMELCYAESGMFILERCDGCLEVLVGG